jgi:adenylosuccinate synthase
LPCSYDIEAELVKYKALAARLQPFIVDAIPIMHEGTALHPSLPFPNLFFPNPFSAIITALARAALTSGKKVMVEGANALMLDIDFGTYPYVTSSSCSVGGASTGLGIPARYLTDVSRSVCQCCCAHLTPCQVLGVCKAYTTRSGCLLYAAAAFVLRSIRHVPLRRLMRCRLPELARGRFLQSAWTASGSTCKL